MKKLLIISVVMLLLAGVILSWSLFFQPKEAWKKGLPKNIVKIAERDLAKADAISMWRFEKCVKEKKIVYFSMNGNLNGSVTYYDADGIKIAEYSYGDWGDEIMGEQFDLSGYKCQLVIK